MKYNRWNVKKTRKSTSHLKVHLMNSLENPTLYRENGIWEVYIFHPFLNKKKKTTKNIDCGCSLELSHQGGVKEHLQPMFGEKLSKYHRLSSEKWHF